MPSSHAEDSRLERAFYDWWDVAQFSISPSYQGIVNIEAFQALDSYGSEAVDFVRQKIVEDRLNHPALEYAVKVLKKEANWSPHQNPEVPKNLLENSGEAFPGSSPLNELPTWGVGGNSLMVAAVEHPRQSRFQSIRISSEKKGGNAVQLATRLNVERGREFVFSAYFLEGRETEKWKLRIRASWLDADAKEVGGSELEVDSSLLASGAGWYCSVLPVERPGSAVFVLLKIEAEFRGGEDDSSFFFVDRMQFHDETR